MRKITILMAVLGLMFTTTAQDLPDYLPTDSLVGYWGFDGDANDYSGNGNNGTVNGATLTEDRHGNANSAYSFDGVDDYIELINSSKIFGQNPDEWSISLWFNWSDRSANTWYNLISDYSASNGADNTFSTLIELNGNNGFINFITRTNSTTYDLKDSLENQNNLWTSIIITVSKNDSKIKFYSNGVLVNQDYLDPNINYFSDTSTLLYVGRRVDYYADLWHMKGDIDDIAMYNRALSAEEIQSLYSGNSCTDTIEVTVYDTTEVMDTTEVIIDVLDTMVIEVLDTSIVMVYDTQVVTINDTNEVMIDVYDTTYVSVNDTLVITMSSDTAAGIDFLTTEVNVYPNPASTQLNVVIDRSGDYTVSLTNINGQMVFTQANVVDDLQIDISDFTKGLYFITITDNDGVLKSEERKIVIE